MRFTLLVRPRSMFRFNKADSLVSDLAFHNFRPVHHMSSNFVFIFRSRRIRNLGSFSVSNTSMNEVALLLEHGKNLRPPSIYGTIFLERLFSSENSFETNNPVGNIKVHLNVIHSSISFTDIAVVERVPENSSSVSFM